MGNLMVSLRNASVGLDIFERGMSVVQGNVSNVATPGYAKQRQGLAAMRADPDSGMLGGVASTGTQDSRSGLIDGTVRQRMARWGGAEERTRQLERMEPVYEIGSESGLQAALNAMMQAVSAAAVSPNDVAARRVVLERAGALTRSFQQASAGLAEARTATAQTLVSGVRTVNALAAEIAEVNAVMRGDYRAQSDPGLQSKLNNALESLSEWVEITVIRGEDGSTSVYAGGQTALVLGVRAYELSADRSSPRSRILSVDGSEVGGQFRSGRLAALQELDNTVLPEHEAGWNRLAEALAERVNATLEGGVDLNGERPSRPLFTYDVALGSARTLRTNDLAPAELALAPPGAPGGNGVALKLEALFRERSLDGVTWTQYYGNLAAAAGRQIESARSGLASGEQMKAQALEMRDQLQGVSLDEEAVVLLEFQRAYQASAQLIRTISEMLETALNMIR